MKIGNRRKSYSIWTCAALIAVAVAFTSGNASGQGAVVDLTLERSNDLVEWEPVPLAPDMLGVDGKIILPTSEESEFFRMQVNITGFPPPPSPEGFALIPPGNFEMGDPFGDGRSNERPVHTVFVSSFYIARAEVTKEQWDVVRTWATNNGYWDLPSHDGRGMDHPMAFVSWYDAVKWLNAWSEMEARDPVYSYAGDVYRTGIVDPEIDYSADGYRLPTEAEWEKAARGGLASLRFPWGNSITHENANFRGDGPLQAYGTGDVPPTSPAGTYPPNTFGVYDTIGNMWEWVADWFQSSYYSESPEVDPRGPATGSATQRIIRGGSWSTVGLHQMTLSYRYNLAPTIAGDNIGFRAAYNAE